MNMVNKDTILFSKVREEAIIPSKREEDGAYDIYACFGNHFYSEKEEYIDTTIIINPHITKLVPTGIATAFSKDWVAIIKERGSTGTKGMGQRCGVIDSGFRGEWFVPITNHNNIPLVIADADKEVVDWIMDTKDYIYYPATKAIAQFIMLPVPQLNTVEVPYEELLEFSSERGTGALGSSLK